MITLRPIEVRDNLALSKIIRTVMQEYRACGDGFSIMDAEVDSMAEAYTKDGHLYLVIDDGKEILGGAGIGPLIGSNPEEKICELKKMYFTPPARGRGLGHKLLSMLLLKAKEVGYDQCYLETLNSMHEARRLYEKFEFKKICSPMGKTGHFGCDSWYLKRL